ncbi:MAG: peptidylprolyl isomerase [Candidatus Omnitrophica bacterium]|nr:peptidylprolyl isomerase [Candidatus Omnitrophota bacterium]MDD5488401.1 peptidylprolyl isomerase [Candidatus Omnitrophota bacterium]
MRTIIVGLSCVALLLCGSVLEPVSATAEVVDKVIVVVNDEVVTQREFDRLFGPIKEGFEKNLAGEDLEEQLDIARKGILEQLINAKLTISLAKKKNITIDEAKLKERVDKIKSYYPSEEEFLYALNDRGTNLSEFEKEIREQMLAQELVEQEVASKITITPSEISDLYEKNKEKMVTPPRIKLRGIMIRKAEDRTPEESQKMIREIQEELKKGADFSEVAKKRSEGPYAADGGDMGYVVKGELLGEIDGPVFNLKKGEVSDVVETSVGYHLFFAEDVQESRPLAYEEVSDFLREQLFMKDFQESLVEWLEEKRKNAYISYK